MNCPRCPGGEIDFSGICLICGYQIPVESEPVSGEPASENTPENPNVSDIGDTEDVGREALFLSEEIPQWRKELAQKLQALRQKKEEETGRAALAQDAEEHEEGEAASKTDFDSNAIRAEFIERLRAHTLSSLRTTAESTPQQKTLQPPPEEKTTPEELQSEENLKSIIDAAVLRQSAPLPESSAMPAITATEGFLFQEPYKTYEEEREMDGAESGLPAAVEDAAPEDSDAASIPDTAEASGYEGRLILLSRTLSGLVDLFLVVLFSGIFLGMADYFTDAPMLSSMSAINFAVLFLMIYFLYSIFFLGTNCQTIGMMVTDLRVVSMNGKHFSMARVVRRNAVFLVSLFGLGIGLLAGIFNRKCLCLHDRLSGTCVERI